jgi:cell wall-associated NlpC family hydrolase
MRAGTRSLASTLATGSPEPEPSMTPRTDRERLLSAAFGLRGRPYRFGAKGPNSYDCSGFAKAAYAAVGVTLPDGSFNQAKGEQPLSSERQLAPGDLLLYRWKAGGRVDHVTLYAGAGWVIGTGTPGQPSKVVVYPLAMDATRRGLVLTFRHVDLPDER